MLEHISDNPGPASAYILPVPHPPHAPSPYPHPHPTPTCGFPLLSSRKGWPRAQSPIQAGGRGKCTVLGPFSEKLRVPGIPGEYLPVPHWPEHRSNNEEVERRSRKQRGASGTHVTFDSTSCFLTRDWDSAFTAAGERGSEGR